MIKRLLEELDYTFFAETSLILFVGIFVVVSIVTLFRKNSDTRRYAHIVLDDQVSQPHSTNDQEVQQ